MKGRYGTVRYRKRKNCGLCAAACVLIAGGVIWLCCLSYRFIFITAAAALILAGILLIKKNC